MSDTTVVSIGDVFTKVIASGTIGPPGPQGPPGPSGPPGVGVAGAEGPRGIGGPIFTMEGVLQTKIGTLKWRNSGATTFEGVLGVVGDAPVGDDILIDVNKNGVSLFAVTKVTIPDGQTNNGALAIPDVVELVDGDEISVDIDQVGSTTPGSDLTVEVFLS